MTIAMGKMKFMCCDDAHEFKPERWIDRNGRFRTESPYKFTAFQSNSPTKLQMAKGKEIIAINLDTSSDNSNSDSDNNTSDSSSTSQISTSEEIDYDSPDYRGPPKSLLKWYGYLSYEYKDMGGNESDAKPSFSDISKTKALQGLLDYYGYNYIEEYLSWNDFPSIDKENTDKDITDKDIIDEDCIHESNYAMSKGKYVLVSKKHNPKVKSFVPVKGCVLGLANVTTWDEIVNKMGVRKSEI
ncbi:hypothetical protein Tco_0600361 [Tanacetum coccineum]|uniref:Uncharacterized protein n=1 Tax=Tanacetum coccineum TaxID=301880 RepID=A0ABQ4WBK6_9ASTR